MKFNSTLLIEQITALVDYVNQEMTAECDITLYGEGSMWIDVYRGDHVVGTGFGNVDDLIEWVEQNKE